MNSAWRPVPGGLVARHGAGGDRLGHGVEDLAARRRAVRGRVGRHGGPRRVGDQGLEQGAAGLVGGPAALHGLGAERRDALAGQQGAGGLHGGVDAGDAGCARRASPRRRHRAGGGAGAAPAWAGGGRGRGPAAGGAARRPGCPARDRAWGGPRRAGRVRWRVPGSPGPPRARTAAAAIHRDRHDGDLEGLPVHRAVDGLAGGGVGPRLVAVHAVADADGAQRAVGDALPDRLDIGGGAELQRGVAAAALEAGGGDAAEHVAGIAAAVGVQHRGAAGAQRVHAHRVGRHLQLLGDGAEGGDEVAGAGAGGPDHLDGAGGAIDRGGRGDGAVRRRSTAQRWAVDRAQPGCPARHRCRPVRWVRSWSGPVLGCWPRRWRGVAAPVAAISTAAICAASCAAPDLATRRGSVSSDEARPRRAGRWPRGSSPPPGGSRSRRRRRPRAAARSRRAPARSARWCPSAGRSSRAPAGRGDSRPASPRPTARAARPARGSAPRWAGPASGSACRTAPARRAGGTRSCRRGGRSSSPGSGRRRPGRRSGRRRPRRPPARGGRRRRGSAAGGVHHLHGSHAAAIEDHARLEALDRRGPARRAAGPTPCRSAPRRHPPRPPRRGRPRSWPSSAARPRSRRGRAAAAAPAPARRRRAAGRAGACGRRAARRGRDALAAQPGGARQNPGGAGMHAVQPVADRLAGLAEGDALDGGRRRPPCRCGPCRGGRSPAPAAAGRSGSPA